MGSFCSCMPTQPTATTHEYNESEIFGKQVKESDFQPWQTSSEDEIIGIRHFTREKVYGLQFLGNSGQSTEEKVQESLKLTQVTKIPRGTWKMKLSFSDKNLTNISFKNSGGTVCAALRMTDIDKKGETLYLNPDSCIVAFRVALIDDGI